MTLAFFGMVSLANPNENTLKCKGIPIIMMMEDKISHFDLINIHTRTKTTFIINAMG
jgi:hypothetical protein